MTGPAAPDAEVPRPRFTLLDALVLVAATALGLWPIRDYLNQQGLPFQRPFPFPRVHYFPALVFWSLHATLVPLAAWTVALTTLRLARWRSMGLRLAEEPGAASCLVATLALATIVVQIPVTLWYFRYSLTGSATFEGNFYFEAPKVAFAVFGAWVVLALSRRPTPGPTWIDRLGWALAASWVFGEAARQVGLLISHYANFILKV